MGRLPHRRNLASPSAGPPRLSRAALALITLLLPLSLLSPAVAAEPAVHPLPTLREQAEIQQAWLTERLTEILPRVMRAHGIDLWLLSMREYAEDPVFGSITSATTFAARRRSIYVLHDRGGEEGVVRLALGGSDQGGLFTAYKDPDPEIEGGELVGDTQWNLLRKLLDEAQPRKIALNIDPVHAFSDGLHAGEREELEGALGEAHQARVVREPRLAIDYISQRPPSMMAFYRDLQETVHALIGTAFSGDVIEPGLTTTDDVRWWLRQRVQELGMTVWFHPSVSLFRQGGAVQGASGVIERGDVLWVDFGVVALGLATDTQHLGYVLREEETQPPAGLRACLAGSNRLQDLLLAAMRPGRSGNEVLAATLAAMRAEGIDGTIYTHPIGDHGHGAGPLIGLWDHQDGVPVRGDLPLLADTWFSIELQATSPIPEWEGQRLPCRQEEEAHLDSAGERHWVYGRQESFHLIR